ncbi:hypothetical protein J2741_000684 [Methanolinea mesophila]|nr:hypothetical protein [Methanolinea mesophila]
MSWADREHAYSRNMPRREPVISGVSSGTQVTIVAIRPDRLSLGDSSLSRHGRPDQESLLDLSALRRAPTGGIHLTCRCS